MGKQVMQGTSPKLFAFVLMPFNKEFDDIYTLGIKEACNEAGCYCERVDEQIFSEGILDRIYNQISKADLIIADMTGQNPNVFYETGYAHALNKKVILLTKEAGDIPFDLKHFAHIVYGNSIVCLRDKLRTRVHYFLNNPTASSIDNSTFLLPYINDVRAENGVVIRTLETPYGGAGAAYRWYIRIDFHNISERMIETTLLRYDLIGDRSIALEIADRLGQCTSADIPDGKRILNIPLTHRFLPNQWYFVKVMVLLLEDKVVLRPGDSARFPVTLRATSETTCRDIEVELQTRMSECEVPF